MVFEAAARVQDGRTSHSGEGGSVKRGPRGKGWVGGVSEPRFYSEFSSEDKTGSKTSRSKDDQ